MSKPTPVDHLIHWLNTHPDPNYLLPGTCVRIADAHDALVSALSDNEAHIEEAERNIRLIEASESSLAARLDRITFRVRQEIDHIRERGTTHEDTRAALGDLLRFVEDNK